MKTIALICLTLFVLCQQKSVGQINVTATHYYDYKSPNVANSAEIAEDVVIDNANNTYVAGEISKETNEQNIRIIKYKANGDSIFGTYLNSTYREYVKKVLLIDNYLFVICNAVNISTNKSTLFILKYNSSLKLIDSSFYLAHTFYSPEDAVNDNNDNLYIACYSRHNNSNALAIVKIFKGNLNFQDSVLYYYQSKNDTYVETPKSIIYTAGDNYVYISGGIADTINHTSATLLIKYNAGGLESSWQKVAALKAGDNIFNSVRASKTRIFAAGRINDSFAVTSYYYAGTHVKTSKYGDTYSDSKQEALKITSASGTTANIIGYSKSAGNNKYNILVANYLSSSNSLSFIKRKTLPYNSAINDAVFDYGSNYVTGWKSSGQNKNLFLYVFHDESTLFYSDVVNNRSAAGNAIAVRDKIDDDGNGDILLRIAGYSDKNTSSILPHDYQFFSRFYFTPEVGFTTAETHTSNSLKIENKEEDFVALSQNIPNPFQNTTTINYALPKNVSSADIIITSTNGKLVKEISIADKTKNSITINASTLANGIYYYSLVTDGKVIDSKQMIVSK